MGITHNLFKSLKVDQREGEREREYKNENYRGKAILFTTKTNYMKK